MSFLKFAVLFVLSCMACVASASYKEVEWIEFTGMQWINTHYIPSCTDTFEMKVRLASTNTTMTLWCSRGSATTEKTMTCFAMNPGVLRFDRNANCGKSSPNDAVTTGRDYTIVANYDTLSTKIDDVEVGPMASGDFTPNGMLTIGASHTGYTEMGNYAKIRVYSFKVTDKDGAVVREFIPAKAVGTGVVGLFDKQTKVFFSACGRDACPFGAEVGDTTYEEEFVGYNVINVPAGVTNNIDVTGLDANKPLVKIGGGTVVVAEELKDFAKDIFIRDGAYKATKATSFGTAAGKTYVDGGTLWSTVSAPSTYTADGGSPSYGSERFYIKGDGYGRYGVIRQTNNGSSNFAAKGGVVFEGNVRIGGTQTLEFRYGAIFCNYCRITVAMEGRDTLFRLVSLGVNRPGSVDVEHGRFGVEAGTGNPSDSSNVFAIKDGAGFYLNNTTTRDARSLVFESGSRLDIGAQAGNIVQGTFDDYNRWDGPVSVASIVATAFGARAKPFNVTGVISGEGGFAATGGGYFQLSNPNNSFMGGISAAGVTGPGDLNVTGGVSVVYTSNKSAITSGNIIPLSGGPISIKNATFGLYGERRSLQFTDLVAEGKCVVTGISATTSFKSLTKKADGPLTVFGPVKVLGATEIQGGTLRFGSRVAPSGLTWYHQYQNAGDVNGTSVLSGVACQGVELTGARYAYDDWLGTDGANGAATHNQCHYYEGYIRIPGEEGADVTCNFVTCIARNIYVRINGKEVAWVNDNKSRKSTDLKYKKCVVADPVTLKAGWQPILIFMGNSWNGTVGPITCDTPTWPKNFGLGVDWQARCEANTDNYQKLLDPGDGSFLRPIAATVGKASVDPTPYRMTFAGAVGFGQGAVLDVNDTAPYTPVTVPELKGMPTIRNGEVKVTGTTWTLRASDFVDGGAPLTVESGAKLTFAPGTTIAFEGDFAALAHRGDNRIRHVLSSAGGGTIENLPSVSRQIDGTDWYLRTSADGKSIDLIHEKGLTILLR